MRSGLVDKFVGLLRPKKQGKPSTRVVIEYSPSLDGDADPGEVVWAWVQYEEDPNQGKDRPVVIIGRRGSQLSGVPLTTKRRNDELQVAIGTGPWDREGRPSYARVERVIDVEVNDVRREGAILKRKYFDDVIAGVQRARQH